MQNTFGANFNIIKQKLLDGFSILYTVINSNFNNYSLNYSIQQESDQLEFITNYNIIKLKSATNVTQDFKLINNINYNQINSLFKLTTNKQIEPNQIYSIQQESDQLEFLSSFNIILTNNKLYNAIFNTIINKSFANLNTSYNIYHLVTNEYTLSYTIDGTFARIKNYSLQYSLSDYTSSILFGFDIEYIIIQCPKLKRYWY